MLYSDVSTLFKVLLFCVVFVSCGTERTHLFLESPDGAYTLKMTHTLGPANSTAILWVGIARGKKNEAKNFEKIFEGRASARPAVYWADKNLVRIDYCRGYILDINSPYYDSKNKKEIYVQIVNAPGLFVNGKQACPEIQK